MVRAALAFILKFFLFIFGKRERKHSLAASLGLFCVSAGALGLR